MLPTHFIFSLSNAKTVPHPTSLSHIYLFRPGCQNLTMPCSATFMPKHIFNIVSPRLPLLSCNILINKLHQGLGDAVNHALQVPAIKKMEDGTSATFNNRLRRRVGGKGCINQFLRSGERIANYQYAALD